ncbi:MAG: Gfo/Idh/MocA family oxidoreductase [Chloroflexi bacterium]|nr:Gfo/Idh/MocA family oxidoreductase [Chloroflexota bacterium]
MSVSIGIVGVGSFGSGFVRLFRDHPLVSRIAVAETHSDRLARIAREYEIAETYASLEEICAANLDALAIFTQPWLHAPQAILAMESGKHVYTAVPIISLGDGNEMLDWCGRLIDTCRRTGMRYMMGETSYYRPQAMYCRKRAEEGEFGQFVLADGEYLHDIDDPGCSLREVARSRWGDAWQMSKSGGIPMHYPTHSIGGLLSVMKAPLVEVSAIGYVHPRDDWFRADTEEANLFSNETALFRCANGAAVRIREFRRVGHYGTESFELFGTEASFRDGPGGCFWVTKNGASPLAVDEIREPLPPEVVAAYRKGQADDSRIYGGHGGSHAYLVNEFVQSVAAGRQPAINAWEAARYFVPGIIAHQSALRDGELLKIPDWGDPPV